MAYEKFRRLQSVNKRSRTRIVTHTFAIVFTMQHWNHRYKFCCGYDFVENDSALFCSVRFDFYIIYSKIRSPTKSSRFIDGMKRLVLCVNNRTIPKLFITVFFITHNYSFVRMHTIWYNYLDGVLDCIPILHINTALINIYTTWHVQKHINLPTHTHTHNCIGILPVATFAPCVFHILSFIFGKRALYHGMA